jgi:hypothetical protein
MNCLSVFMTDCSTGMSVTIAVSFASTGRFSLYVQNCIWPKVATTGTKKLNYTLLKRFANSDREMRYFTPWGRPGHTEQRKASFIPLLFRADVP